MAKRTCSVVGCDRPTVGQGLCGKHWQRKRKGLPLLDISRDISIDEKFFRQVVVEPLGCMIWQGAKFPNGYARFVYAKTNENPGAHRWAYVRFRGPIPTGFVLDHLCRVKECVNPWHLEIVTPKENVRRGLWGEMTHCPKGHEFTPENTGCQKNGRYCKQCVRDRLQRYREERKLKLD